MIRKFFREKRVAKYVCLTAGLAVVCTAVLFALSITNAFGKFEAKEPYVTGQPMSNTVTVTPEGQKTEKNRKEENQKGANGSGAEPCSPKVPTCEGLKGSETNPFVLLEIVPDLSHQQMTYLAQEEGSTQPFDLMKMGIELGHNYLPGSNYGNIKTLLTSMGIGGNYQWFSKNEYSVYKIGGGGEKENLTFVDIDKLYSIKVTDAQINEMTGDDKAAERFGEIFKETKQGSSADVKKLSEQFPNVFEKDSDGKKIRGIALDDSKNWEAKKESKTIVEEDAETYTSGYMVMVEPGKGEFGFASQQARQNWEFTKTGTDADRWVYVETEEEMKEKYPEYLQNYNNNVSRIYQYWFFYKKKDGSTAYPGDMDLLYKDQENPDFTGLVCKLDNNLKCKYVKTPRVSKDVYSFDYYGLTNHNILKRGLFTFKNQEEYDNFHMQVIAMTPAQLNKLCESDTDATVDMIERADMYVIQALDLDGSKVDVVDDIKKLYYNYLEPDKKRSEEDITFYENDLEWSLCQKIIQRVSAVKTIPLVFNKVVPELLELGISRNRSEKETHMYVTAKPTRITDEKVKGSRNNISKLYLITIQFDLLARKKTESSYERTFMEDIYPDIKTISIPPEKGVVDGTARTTGYYKGSIGKERKLCTCPISGKITQEFKERVYYLWNTYTFFPVDIEEKLDDGNLSQETRDNLIKQGYLNTYLDQPNGTGGNPFNGSKPLSNQNGSDGYDNKNVTVIGNQQVANANQSTMLGTMGGAGGFASDMMDVFVRIMANDNQQVNPVTVTAEEQRKMYVKMADDTVMIDYEDDGKLEKEKKLYLKVRIWNNENNRPGQVKSISLVKDKSEINMKLYEDKTFTKECEFWKNKNNEYVKGTYNVPSNAPYLEGYVEFNLSDWKKGYKTMRFDTVGYNYDSKKKREESTDNRCDISIIGKTLFELQ